MDIIIFMILAVLLGVRLWNLLGKGPFGPSSSGKIIRLNQNEVEMEKQSTPFQTSLYEGFDEEQFLSGAQQAFLGTLRAYFQKDDERLAKFVTPALFKKFKTQTPPSPLPLVEILSLHIQEQELHGDTARLTVHFLSQQGNAQRAEEVEEAWVFERNITSSHPNWVISKIHRY